MLKREHLEFIKDNNINRAYNFNDLNYEEAFELCLGVVEDFDSKIMRTNIDYTEIRKFLKGNVLKRYSELLILRQQAWFYYEENFPSFEEGWDVFYGHNTHAIEMTETLLMLINSISSKHGVDLSISNINDDKVRVNNKIITETIFNSLVEEYKKSKLDYLKITIEEARQGIRSFKDKSWFKNYCFDEEIKMSQLDVENPSDEMVGNYISGHFSKKDITKEFLELKLNELKAFKRKKKTGPKLKNNSIANLAIYLSYLIRLESFLSQGVCEHIFDFTLDNEACRIIYDYFDFWGLIVDNLTGKTPSARHSFIASMINERKKRYVNFERNDVIFYQERRIDNFWRLCHPIN